MFHNIFNLSTHASFFHTFCCDNYHARASVFPAIFTFQIEEEIVTLKQALDRKEKQLAEIKRLLGITAWSQLKDGFHQQYQNLQGTQMYVFSFLFMVVHETLWCNH